MKKFNQTNPLAISYQTNPKAPASDLKVTKAIRDQLKSKNPTIFTDTVVAEITFSNTALEVNNAVKVEATYNTKATSIYVKELPETVDHALKKFNQTNPLEIPYQNSTASASYPEVAGIIRKQLGSKNPVVFTTKVVKKITFSNTTLQPNTAVLVQATYEKKATPIYVQEATNPSQGVYDALASFDQNSPIEIPYQNNPKASASDPKVVKSIKSQMKLKDIIFTEVVLKKITFSNTPLQPNTAVLVQATYEKKATPIYVKEAGSSEAQDVINALQKFNTPATAVEIDAKYVGKYTDKYSPLGLFSLAGDLIRRYI